MASTLSFGWKSDETTKSIAIPAIVYGDSYTPNTKLAAKPGEVYLSGTTQPTGQNEVVKIATSPIKDVYKDNIQGIDPSAYFPVKQGWSTVIQLYETGRYTFGSGEVQTGPGYADFPCSARIVFTYPNVPYVTPDIILGLLTRTYAFLYGSGADVTSGRLNELMRGNLYPPGIIN